MGLLTDLTSEVFLKFAAAGRERLWPLIDSQFLMWCVGRPQGDSSYTDEGVWWPCEALVRVACNEIQRLPERVTVSFPELDESEKLNWTTTFLVLFANALTKTVQHERNLQHDLFRVRKFVKGSESKSEKAENDSSNLRQQHSEDSGVQAPDAKVNKKDGHGKVVEKRRVSHENENGDEEFTHLAVNITDLDFVGTLYRPDAASTTLENAVEVGKGAEAVGKDSIPLFCWFFSLVAFSKSSPTFFLLFLNRRSTPI